ncbi:MAG: hypothetical protein IIA45_10285, partial [Bacteroidetes bacterium]|nr:hypothetical protein [Bacteroidota bacterium]
MSPKKRSKKSGKKRGSSLVKEVYNVFRDNPGRGFNHKQLAKQLGLKDSRSKSSIHTAIDKLWQRNMIIEEKRGRYVLPGSASQISGIIDMTRSGSAYLLSEKKGPDVYIPSRNLGTALDGDEVVVTTTKRGRAGKIEG